MVVKAFKIKFKDESEYFSMKDVITEGLEFKKELLFSYCFRYDSLQAFFLYENETEKECIEHFLSCFDSNKYEIEIINTSIHFRVYGGQTKEEPDEECAKQLLDKFNLIGYFAHEEYINGNLNFFTKHYPNYNYLLVAFVLQEITKDKNSEEILTRVVRPIKINQHTIYNG